MTHQQRRAYRGPLQAIIFDWAGTTVDYGSMAPVVVFREVFRQHGVEITIEEARAPMGLAKKDHIREVTEMERVAACWQEVHGRACTPADIDAMYADFVPLQLDVLISHAGVIPGTVDAVAACRERGLRIGSTTGYTRSMMDILVPAAARQGYAPDACLCPSDVPAGRPAPWMCFLNAMQLNVYPMAACVKVGDTLADIAEGLNANMWTIGVVRTGNELGMTEAEVAALSPDDLERRLEPIRRRFLQSGAHFVADSVADVPRIIDDIAASLEQGVAPI